MRNGVKREKLKTILQCVWYLIFVNKMTYDVTFKMYTVKKVQRRCVNMRLKVFSIVKPILCPRCHKPYKVNIFKRCVHCGAYLGGIKW